MASVIGALRVDLGLNSAAFMKGLDEAARRLAKTQAAFAATGARMQSVGRALSLGLTLPLTAFAGTALKAGGDFEAAMNRVGAITGAVGGDLTALRDAAKAMGATTQFSASEAADALGFLGMAGFSAGQAIEALPGTLQLAAAAGMDLAQSADIVSNVLSGYGMGVADLARVNDVLVKTFTSSNTDLVQLGEAMKYAGPIASAAGVSFEQSAAAIGLMGNAGIQASMAGTSLRGAIGRILSPTGAASAAMQSLGLSFTDAAGKILPLDQILTQLEPHADDAGLFMELFGQRAGPAMAALVSQGSAALVDLQTKLENAGGTAARIAAAQMEGFNGAVKQLQSAFEGLQIAIAESGLLSLGERIAESLAGFLGRLSELDPAVLRVGTVVAGLAAALGPLAIAAGIAVASIGALLPVLAVVGPPALLVGAAIGTLWLAMQKGEGVAARVGEILRGIPFIAVGASALEAAGKVAGFVRSVGSIGSAFVVAKAVATEGIGRLGTIWEGMRQLAAGAWQGLRADALEAMAGVLSAVPGIVNPIIGAWVGARAAIAEAWATLPAALGAPVAAAANAVIAGVESAINKGVALINSFVSSLPAKVREVLGWSEIGSVTIDRVPVTLAGTGDRVQSAFTDAMGRNYVGELTAHVAGLAQEARGVADAFGAAGQATMQAATAPLESVRALGEASRMLSRNVADGAGDMETATDAATDSAVALEDALNDAGDAAENLGGGGGGGARRLRDELDETASAARTAADAVAGVGKSFLSDLVSNPGSAFQNAFSGIKSAAGNAFSNMVFNPGGLVAGVKGAFSSLTTGISGLFSGGGLAAIGTAIGGALPFIGAGIAAFNLIKNFSKTTQIGEGLKVGVKDGKVVGSTYERFKKTYFWGLFKKKYEEDTALTKKARSALQAQVDAVRKSVSGVFEGLGVSVPDAILNRVRLAVKKIKTEGKSADEIQSAVAAVFEKYGDAMAKAVGKIGLKAAGALLSVQAALAPVGKAFDLFARQSSRAGRVDLRKFSNAASALADLVGGVEALGQKTGAFYDGFFTDAEKLDYMQGVVADTFKRLKLSVPATDEAFKKLALSQNLLTTKGRETFAALIEIAPVFDQITDAADGVTSAVANMRAAYQFDGSEYATAWEARFADELANPGRYTGDLLNAQNELLRQQISLLEEIRNSARSSAASDATRATAARLT